MNGTEPGFDPNNPDGPAELPPEGTFIKDGLIITSIVCGTILLLLVLCCVGASIFNYVTSGAIELT